MLWWSHLSHPHLRLLCLLEMLTMPARNLAGGVIPHIHKSLISKGPKAKKSKKNRPE